MDAVFDTCILIDYLKGIEAAKAELKRYSRKSISVVTWMEVMVGTTAETDAIIRNFLRSFRLMPIDSAVCERAVQLRKSRKIRLPDAIIWATAETSNLLLVTRNTKDFDANEPGVRVPYTC